MNSDSPTRTVPGRQLGAALTLVLTLLGVLGGAAARAAGCGAVCLPLEALDPQNAQVNGQQLRLSLVGQYADFDQYRQGTDSLPNPANASATIWQVTGVADYGITPRWTASLLVPYVHKHQQNKKFGDRTARGLGDVALFGRYAALTPVKLTDPSLSVGLGIKFPTGSTDQPGDAADLPPAMQTGSGAYDAVPTVSYFQRLGGYSLYGSALYRIPLEANDRGYRFGRELDLHFGTVVPLAATAQRVALLASLDYTHAQRDTDNHMILPAKVRDGTTVLNTGGRFLDFTPGVRVHLDRRLALQLRVSIPVYQYWNGDRSRGVGQVAQRFTTQLSLIYTASHRF